jgi:DNA-binding protein YbaB
MVSISIDPEAVDPDDVEMLEDLVMAAISDAAEKSRQLSQEKMQSLGLPTGGLGGMM